MALFNGESVYPLIAQFMPFKPGPTAPPGVTEGGMWYDFSTKQYKGIINGVITVINGVVTSLFGAGAPPGGAGQCTDGQTYTNTTNGNFYSCNVTTWTIVSGSAVTVAQLNAIQPRVLDTTALAGANLGARLNTCNSQLGANGGICNTLNEPFNLTFSTAAVLSNPITVWGCGKWFATSASPNITFSSAGGGGLVGCPDKGLLINKGASGTLLRVSGTNNIFSDILLGGGGNASFTGTIIDPTGSADAIFTRVSLSNLDVSGIQTTAAANRLVLDRIVIGTPLQAASSGIILVGGSATILNSTVNIISGTGDALSATGSPSSIVVRDSTLSNTGTSGTGLTCTTCSNISITGSTLAGTTRALNAFGASLTAIGNSFSGGVIESVLIGNNTTPVTLFTNNFVGCGHASVSGMGCIHLKGDSIANVISNNTIHQSSTTPTGNNYCIWLDTNAATHFLQHIVSGNTCEANEGGTSGAGYLIDNTSNTNCSVSLIDNVCTDVGTNKCVVRIDTNNVGNNVLRNNSINTGSVYGTVGSTSDVFSGSSFVFAGLPNAGNLSHVFCPDCTQNTPTAGSGAGAHLFRSNSQWIGLRSPTIGIVSGSDYTNATTTFSNVTGLSWAVPTAQVGPTYSMHCSIVWSASAATAGPQFQITGPTAVTLAATMVSAITSSTTASAATTTFGSAMNPVGATVTSGVNEFAMVDMGWTMGGTSGTIQLQAAAQGVGTLTIRQGSYCQFQ